MKTREQIVVIHYNKLILACGGVTFLFGFIALIIAEVWNNDKFYFQDKNCPVLGGKIHSFLLSMAYFLILVGTFDFTSGGLMPKIFLVFNRKEVTICCGHMFMGVGGQVFQMLLYFGVLALNVNGTTVIMKAKEIIHTKVNSDNHASFCNSNVLAMSYTINGLTYIFFLSHLVLSILEIRRISRSKKKERDRMENKQMNKMKFNGATYGKENMNLPGRKQVITHEPVDELNTTTSMDEIGDEHFPEMEYNIVSSEDENGLTDDEFPEIEYNMIGSEEEEEGAVEDNGEEDDQDNEEGEGSDDENDDVVEEEEEEEV